MTLLFETYRAAFRGLPRQAWMLSLVMLVNRSGTMVLAFLSLYVTQDLGFPLVVAGQVLSIYGLGHLGGALLGGWLADRVGVVRIQIGSLILSGIGFIILEHLRTLPSIMLVVFLTAVCAEALRPANGAAIVMIAPPHLRTRVWALNRMAVNLGSAIGPALGGFLAMVDYAWIFRVDGVTCILAGLLMSVLFRHGLDEESGEAVGGVTLPSIHPIRDPVFLVFLMLTGVYAAILLQAWSTYPIYLKEVYGFTEGEFGLLITLNGLIIISLEMVLTHKAERFRPLRMVALGSFLLATGFALLPFGHGALMAILSVVVWTFGEMLGVPFAGGFVANRAGARHRGRYMGLFVTAWAIAFTISPFVGTWVYDTLGPEWLWYLIGLLGPLLGVAALALDRWASRRERPALEPAPIEPVEAQLS